MFTNNQKVLIPTQNCFRVNKNEKIQESFCWRQYKNNISDLVCNTYKSYFIQDPTEIAHKKVTSHLSYHPKKSPAECQLAKRQLVKRPPDKCPRFIFNFV